MDNPPEPPKTPPNKFPNPPTPCGKTPPPRITCDFNTRDEEGPFYWENRNKTPDFEVAPLEGGDFRERPTDEEWADKLGYKLPSGESVLAGRPDPSELKAGAKLPPSIEEIDRLLKKGNQNPTALIGESFPSEPNLKPGAILTSAEGQQKMANMNDPKPSSERSKKPKVELGAMLPPLLKAPGGLQKKAARQTLEIPSEKFNKPKQEVGAMPQRLLKGAARLQEMADLANPLQAEEERAKVFMDHLPHVQAASRRLQGQLDIHSDETWPLPPLPKDHNPFIVETNAVKIRAALDSCKDFAVTTDRESGKLQFLDVIAKYGKKRVVMQAGQAPVIRLTSFDDEKKAEEAEASNAIARMMGEGLHEELKQLGDEGMSEVPSTPKSLFHSVGPTPSPSAPQTSQRSTTAASEDEDIPTASQGGSSEATAERERREEWEELTRDPHFRGIGPYGWAEYDSSTAPDSADRSEATGATPEWVYQENATPNSHYDSEGNSIAYTMPTASNDDQDMHTPSHENETASHDDQEMYTPSHENATASSDAQELYTSSHENATASSDAQDMYTSSHENATASSDAQEMYTTSRENEMVSAASVHLPATFAPPGRELGALSVHDSEQGVTQSIMDEAIAVLNAQDKGKGRETSLGVGTMMSTGPEAEDKGKGKEASSSIGENCSYASQNQQKGKGKQTISDFGNAYMDDGEERHGNTGSGRAKLDVAASLRNHSVTFLDETLPKIKERSPPVPQPEKMPGTLTQAICNYIPLEAKSILTLTLERVDSPVPSPTDQRCVLLKHFEVGLDGVEGLCQGTAKIPETPERIAERERRIGKIGTFKQGDGGFYRSLKSAQQKEQQYGKGYWYFFGVKFKQTGREKKLRRGGKWLLFGAPIEAVYHLDIKRTQENVAILLGGGVDQFGTAIKPFKANFKRTHTLFSRGGIAPMDIWSGGEDWDDGVFRDIRAATANNGLRVGFLYADTQTFTPRPMGFPAAGKLQAEKKRKQSGPEMTEDEMKAMEKRMKPKKLSDEDIGAILAMRIINDRAREDAAARSK